MTKKQQNPPKNNRYYCIVCRTMYDCLDKSNKNKICPEIGCGAKLLEVVE